MTPEPTPVGTVAPVAPIKGLTCCCRLVICTTAGRTCCETWRIAEARSTEGAGAGAACAYAVLTPFVADPVFCVRALCPADALGCAQPAQTIRSMLMTESVRSCMPQFRAWPVPLR